MANENVDLMDILRMNNVCSEYRTLQDIVYDTLRDDILSGKLPPDSPLNTSELSRQMNISRTPIREAINKLASIGLVSKPNHKEAKVASFMSDEIHEIFYVRSALEGLAARISAKEMNERDKMLLTQLVDEAFLCAKSGDDEKFMENDYVYHSLIYKSIKTPLIRSLCEQLYLITRCYRSIAYGLKSRHQLASRNQLVAEEHDMIARCICAGDEESAERYGILHHQNTVKIISESYPSKK
ncbi:GntR family transcriptional regulator [Youxingia wuxianensis]|uniref:GntR family transcriptional regulator n=1 Tax=Youxingia wuxianensis TaxID=2763678 RepID=A0A926ES60_9FIRM|nr:GntR family transcriptional regulator [Youxingia wuxianensis]MBC8585280.1 GntR family transcriptional regulator [Youxingia wuxianensis]